MKKFNSFLGLVLLASTTTVYAQGTQISGSQIKDGAITNVKISATALIDYTKINFALMPASIVNAENPLTFNTPLSRTGNTISMSVNPVTLGGTGLTSVTAGRLLFGGNSSQLATHTNLTYDSANSRLFVGGTSGSSTLNVNGNLLVTGSAFSINGKSYTFPSAYGLAGSVLTDVAGDGIITWEPTASAGVTLQGSDPGTPDTGGIYVSGNVYSDGILGMTQTTRPTSNWSGPTLPSAQIFNTNVSSNDQAGIGTSQQAIVWADAADGYVADFYSTSGTNGHGILVQSSFPQARLFTGSSTGSDKFIVFNTGNVFVGPDNAALPEQPYTGSSYSFLNLGSNDLTPANKYGIHMNLSAATGFTAADNWTGVDAELAFTGTTSLSTMRGGLFRVVSSGDLSVNGRGLFAAITLNGTTGTQTAPELTGSRIFAEVANAGTHTVTDIIGGRYEVFLDGGTNNITNSYVLYADNQFNGSVANVVTNAFGVKLFNTWDASAAVTNSYGFAYQHPTSGVVTNEIGLYIDSVNANAGSYAIYVGGGQSYFNGPLKAQYLAETVGAPVADAATISPTAGNIFHVTGTGTPVATVTVPYSGFTGSVILIADDVAGFTTTTGGNIAVGSTVTQNHTLTLTYDGSAWYPNY